MKSHYPLAKIEEGTREYCGDLTREAKAEYRLLVEAAAELRAALAPHSRVKALRVSAHLSLSAWLMRSVLSYSVSCYATFMKEFGEDLFEERKPMSLLRGSSSSTKSAGGMKFPGGRS